MNAYVGTKDSYNTIKKHQKLLEKNLKPRIEALNKKIVQEVPRIVQETKQEILGLFQMVAYKEFQSTFYKYYGNNYDVNMVNNSLSFSIDDKLQPRLTYKIKDFYIDTDFASDKKAFNQNANIEGSFGRLMEFDVLDTVEEMDFCGTSIQEDSPYQWVSETQTGPTLKQVFSKKRKIFDPSEIYQEAYANTMQEFDIQYNMVILPRLIGKFNL